MLTKTHTIFSLLARQKEESANKELTRKQWITADRILITLLFLSAIIGAVIFS